MPGPGSARRCSASETDPGPGQNLPTVASARPETRIGGQPSRTQSTLRGAAVMSERSIFMEALEFDDPREQAEFLERACGGDRRLRERVEALLRSHRSGGLFVLDRPP